MRRTSSSHSSPCGPAVFSTRNATCRGGPCGIPSFAPPQWPVQPDIEMNASAQAPSRAWKPF